MNRIVADPDLPALFTTRILRLARHLRETLGEAAGFVFAPSDEAAAGRLAEARAAHPAVQALPFDEPVRLDVPGLVLPMDVGTALDLLDAGVAEIATTMAQQVRTTVELLVEPKLRAATLARTTILVDRWPRPRLDTGVAAFALHSLTSLVGRALPEGEEPPVAPTEPADEEGRSLMYMSWPPDAALLKVMRWARKALNDAVFPQGDQLVALAERALLPMTIPVPSGEGTMTLPPAVIAYVWLAEQDVRAGRRKPAIAIDAGKVHHDMVGGMRDWPKDGKRHRGAQLTARTVTDADQIERVELFSNGSPVQLSLPMPELVGMQDHAIEALRKLRGPVGLRHWAALLRLFSVEGGRTGTYRWMLDEHLAAMGYDERQQRDPDVRAEAAREVEALAGLELAIYTSGGVLRERRRLLLETGRFERLVGSEYKLEGIEFQMNQRVYSGVRESTGEIGRKWMPAPIELAQIDHVRQPYAHGLGMMIAIRTRWRIDEAADFLDLSGDKLLRLAGIEFRSARAERAWAKLRRTLDALVGIGQIESYRWLGEAWTLSGVCRIVYAQWLTDRAGRGIVPIETSGDRDKPVTGAELRTWREKRGWSIREAARHLGVSHQAISKAEAKPEEPLGHKLRVVVDPLLHDSAGAVIDALDGAGDAEPGAEAADGDADPSDPPLDDPGGPPVATRPVDPGAPSTPPPSTPGSATRPVDLGAKNTPNSIPETATRPVDLGATPPSLRGN